MVYAVLVALSILVNGPGRLNPDSAYMLWQGQNLGELNDWHSPVATLIYSLFTPMFGAPNGALFVQSALMLVLPALWVGRLARCDIGRVQRIASVLLWLAVTTTLIALAGQIVKDVLGLCFLSIGLAVVELARDRERTPLTWLVAGFSLVAFVLQRPTGLLAVIPALIAVIALHRPRGRRWASAAGAALFVGIALLAVALLPPFLGAQKTHPENTPIVFDLAGLSTRLHEDLFAPLFLPNEAKQKPWACYTPRSSDDFFWGKCQEYEKLVEAHQPAVAAAWIPAIVHHPSAYLLHRASFARELLMVHGSTSLLPAPPDFTSGVANLASAPPSETLAGVRPWHPTISYVPFGRVAYFILCQTRASDGLVWLFALVLLPVVALWLTGEPLARDFAVLSIFGIANAVVMVFTGPAAEARYLLPTWWCLMVEIVAFAATPWGRGLPEA